MSASTASDLTAITSETTSDTSLSRVPSAARVKNAATGTVDGNEIEQLLSTLLPHTHWETFEFWRAFSNELGVASLIPAHKNGCN